MINKNLELTNKDKTLHALQRCELDCLKELDRICRKHDIKYSLGGGTSLGQVRHRGFIPWDDDIDVDMTLENYDKFKKVIIKELDNNKFYFRSRETDQNYYRSCSRLEMKNSTISMEKWDINNIKVGVFIDIFSWSYLPNNRVIRKIVSSLLFYLRCIENFKMFNQIAKKTNKIEKLFVVLFSKLFSTKTVITLDNKLQRCCGNRKTKWIIDDAIINGNHGGYSSEGIDEYVDVKFEDAIVMNKKKTDNFLSTIYGDNYMEWLEPAKRISHHNWTKLKLEKLYTIELPDNYSHFLTTEYNITKLRHMQKLSLALAAEVDKICEKHNITYSIWGKENLYIKEKIEKYFDCFEDFLNIALPRSEYNRFLNVYKNQYQKKGIYYLETENESDYLCSKLKLRYTSVNFDGKDSEFFIRIIPLDSKSVDIKKLEKQKKKIESYKKLLYFKTKNKTLKEFYFSSGFTKIKTILLLPFPTVFLKMIIHKEMTRFNKQKSDEYIDFVNSNSKQYSIKKEAFTDFNHINYLGYNLCFVKGFEDLEEKIKKNDIKINEFIKNKEKMNREEVDQYLNLNLAQIKKKSKFCNLYFFDDKDYQLSILRYDEKRKEYKTNKELFGYDLDI